MNTPEMTSMERVLSTLSQKEPDRVPLFLLLTMHGAKELGLNIKTYFSKAEYVVEGQLKMLKKFKNDCLYPFFYAPLEIEAFGGEVIYTDDGPPNSGTPVISDIEKIATIQPPTVAGSKMLHRVLHTIEKLKEKVKDRVPIIAVVMSPFSLPVMQLGFDRYFDILHTRKDLFEKLMQVNEIFCVDWANAQLKAGATAICYFDPVSSTTIIPKEMYAETGKKIAKSTISKIKGPTATHFASGQCLPIIDEVAQTGTAIVGVSSQEDLSELKKACNNKLTILGNLNGIEMRRWTTDEAYKHVCNTIQKAANGGGFILSDNHGEIPYQVKEDVLLAISEAVNDTGIYPLK